MANDMIAILDQHIHELRCGGTEDDRLLFSEDVREKCCVAVRNRDGLSLEERLVLDNPHI